MAGRTDMSVRGLQLLPRLLSYENCSPALANDLCNRLSGGIAYFVCDAMKQYPTIIGAGAHNSPKGLPCIAFRKYDGSNLRFEWDRKKGWHLFGTRHQMFDKTDPTFGPAIDIFMTKYAEGIEQVIAEDKYFRGVKEVICFCEYFGPFSFGGQHDPEHPALLLGGCEGNNDPKDLVLFDVNVHKKGLMTPRDFVNTFDHLPIAETIYEGNLNASFTKDVREGKYPVTEGVVCKGLNGRAPHGIWMVKIKTLAYLEELKKRFAEDWEKYWE